MLCVFRSVSKDEITKIINELHCLLDPAPNWLIKQLSPQLTLTIADMCNASFAGGVLLSSQKHAIVKPRLKKPTLDSDNLNSYRLISNLSFISKTNKRVVIVRFNEHCEANKLIPVCQQPYRAFRSTETVVTIVHNNVVWNNKKKVPYQHVHFIRF